MNNVVLGMAQTSTCRLRALVRDHSSDVDVFCAHEPVDASVSVAQPDAGAAAAESEDDGSSQDNTRPGMGCSSTELPGDRGVPASLALVVVALVARRRRAR